MPDFVDGQDYHRCVVTGCDVDLPPRLLMCKPHWRQVPHRLQKHVIDAFWVRVKYPSPEATKNHIKACSDATRAVEAPTLQQRLLTREEQPHDQRTTAEPRPQLPPG